MPSMDFCLKNSRTAIEVRFSIKPCFWDMKGVFLTVLIFSGVGVFDNVSAKMSWIVEIGVFGCGISSGSV